MFKIQSETRGEQTGLIDEMIGNQKVVQVFGRGEDVTERFDEINERLNRASLRATFFSSITIPPDSSTVLCIRESGLPEHLRW